MFCDLKQASAKICWFTIHIKLATLNKEIIMKTIFNFLVVILLITNSGSSSAQWVQTNGPINVEITDFASSGADLFASTSAGIYLSTNLSSNWQLVGLSTQRFSSIVLGNSYLFAGSYDSGVFRSSNNGISWESVGLVNFDINDLVFHGINLFAATGGGAVQRSFDNGNTWTIVASGITSYWIFELLSKGTDLFAGGLGGIYRSTNNGDSWNVINNGIPGGVSIARFTLSGSNIIASASEVGLFFSNNNGDSWTPINNGLPNYIFDLAARGSNIYTGFFNGGNGVWFSSNNGSSWSSMNEGFGNQAFVTSLFVVNNYLFAGTTWQSVWKRDLDSPLPVELKSFTYAAYENNVRLKWTTDSEINNFGFEIERLDARNDTENVWKKISFVQGKGTISSSTNYEYIDKNLLSGKYKYRLKQIDYNGNFEYYNLANEVVIEVPKKLSLSQNYPNPFNPSTKINFELPVSGIVNIKLFDLSGKEIRKIINEARTAGYHTLEFNAEGLSSGVYIYKFEVDGILRDTKQMIILK